MFLSVTYAFQSESPLYICLNVNELLVRNRSNVWSLSDCNGNRTHNHLVRQWTLNHLAKLSKWLSCVVSTYLYGAFDCVFLSCHIRVSKWIHTLYLLECQGTPYSKQGPYLKLKWGQWDLNPEPLTLWMNTLPFSQTGQMIELCCNYLSVRCIWLCFYHVTYVFQSAFKSHCSHLNFRYGACFKQGVP